MFISPSLQKATFLRRYKRFLADIRLPSGEEVTIHCPNTGSMKACAVAGSPCWYSTSDNPKRKYSHTWEVATTSTGDLACINTGRANHLVREGIENQLISELQGYETLQAEVRYGHENSRIDFLLSNPVMPSCYVEVKSVTLGVGGGRGLFPDAVSTRASKHLRELLAMVEEGHRAVLIFCVQHTGIQSVAPADEIDSNYGKTLREVVARGVEVFAYQASIAPDRMELFRPLPVDLSL